MMIQNNEFPNEATMGTGPSRAGMIPMATPEAVEDGAYALAARVRLSLLGERFLGTFHEHASHPDDAGKIAAELDFEAAGVTGVKAHTSATRARLSPALLALEMLCRGYTSSSGDADQEEVVEIFPWGIPHASAAPVHDTATLAPLVYAPDSQATDAEARRFLSEALEELGELEEYAAESELPPPAPSAVESARRILEKVTREAPLYYSVSPGEDGDVAIQVADNHKNGVMILCNAEGGASCYVSMADESQNRHAHYDSAGALPDSFVLEALRELERDDA